MEDSKLIIDAHYHYRYGLGKPMKVDASRLYLNGITQRDLVKNPTIKGRYTLDLFHANHGKNRFSGTAILLGTVSLQHLGGDSFYLLDDRYDFDMQDWSTSRDRNIATLVLWTFNTFWSVDVPWSLALAGYSSFSWIFDKKKKFGHYGFDIHFYNRIIEIPE